MLYSVPDTDTQKHVHTRPTSYINLFHTSVTTDNVSKRHIFKTFYYHLKIKHPECCIMLSMTGKDQCQIFQGQAGINCIKYNDISEDIYVHYILLSTLKVY